MKGFLPLSETVFTDPDDYTNIASAGKPAVCSLPAATVSVSDSKAPLKPNEIDQSPKTAWSKDPFVLSVVVVRQASEVGKAASASSSSASGSAAATQNKIVVPAGLN